jgi:ribosomal protein L11 methyltransferase
LKSDWPPSSRPDPDHDRAQGLTEFEVLAEAESAEALSDALLEAGALSVSLEDADAPLDEQPIFAEPGDDPARLWRLNRLRVLLGPDCTPDGVLAAASRALDRSLPTIAAVRSVGDQDWVRCSQAQFAPLKIGRLWIVPSWVEPPDPAALNVRLDPGLAFGTGAHPSTSLCLRWLQAHVEPGIRVLDYGCGSGILAIAAARLGAGSVTGVDIDPLARRTALENSRRNAVEADYTAPDALRSEHAGRRFDSRRFDIVIANILANPLIVLAPVLVGLLGERGSIALAGVLAHQAGALIGAYRSVDPRLDLAIWDRDGDWVCLAGRRAST